MAHLLAFTSLVVLVVLLIAALIFETFLMMITGCRFGQTECVLFLPVLRRDIAVVIRLARTKDASPKPARHTFTHLAVDKDMDV